MKRVYSGTLALSSVILGACGSTPTVQNTQTTQSPSLAKVATILTSKTAQVLLAGTKATFTVTALTVSGKPAVDEPVSFTMGQMVPLSGVPVKDWFETGSAGAAKYVSSFEAKTNSLGQSSLVLNAQPTGTMEMIGVQVGSLSSYSPSKVAIASMDAWWTTPSATGTAPVGDYVTVSPFETTQSAPQRNLSVLVSSSIGPISGAQVDFVPKKAAAPSSANSMGNPSTGASTTSGYSVATNASGLASYTSTGTTPQAIRIVATQAGSANRIAGGMNIFFAG